MSTFHQSVTQSHSDFIDIWLEHTNVKKRIDWFKNNVGVFNIWEDRLEEEELIGLGLCHSPPRKPSLVPMLCVPLNGNA